MPVILKINDVPYEVIVETEDGTPELRLYNSAGDGYTGFKSREVESDKIKIFTIPEEYAEPGLHGHMVSDEDGLLEVITPYPHILDLAGSATLTDVINKVNTILAALVAKYIVQPNARIIEVDPITLGMSFEYVRTIAPEPIEIGFEFAYETPHLPISPDPITVGLETL